MAKKIKIAVLFGGCAPEHSSSIDSSSFPLTFSDKDKYEIHAVYIRKDSGLAAPDETFQTIRKHFEQNKGLLFDEADPRPTDGDLERMSVFPRDASRKNCVFVDNLLTGAYDFIFPIFHGQLGQDGHIQSLAEYAGIPYFGCSSSSSVLCNDKEIMKHFYLEMGIPVCDFMTVFDEEWGYSRRQIIHAVEDRFPYPVFVKPANLGSSIGVCKAHDREEFVIAVETAFCYSSKVLVEETLTGREIGVSLLGNEDPLITVPTQFVYKNAEFFNYKAKYEQQCHSIIPAEVTGETRERLQDMTRKVFNRLKMSGMARVDFFVDDEDSIHLLEVNTTPSLYTDSTYVMVMEYHGISKVELFNRFIKLGFDRFYTMNTRQ
jgi:D-alanine-D-alanine ligase